ncbi:hypothetical protein LguiA_035984 [Lonicera macranthoides]
MIEEMEALKKNDTWELITLPRGKRTVGCRWVYTLKHKADRSIERARIVAKGFTQTYGIDYLETFAPVAKLNSIPYESFCQLQLTDLGHCISSMSKLSSWRPPRIGLYESSTRFSSSGGGRESLQVKKGDIWSHLLGLGSRYEVWL